MNLRRGNKLALLTALALLIFVDGLFDATLASGRLKWTIFVVGVLAGSLLLFAWYWHDANGRGHRRSYLLNTAMIFLPGLALIYYLLRSRGIGRGLLAITGFAGFALVCIFLAGTGMWLGYHHKAGDAEQVVDYPETGSGSVAFRRTISPYYPIALAMRGAAGTATVWVRVGPDGKPIDVRLESGTGFPELDEEALQVVRHWEFYPQLNDGEPVESTAIVPVVFAPN